MSKQELVAAIHDRNESARPDFLMSFDEQVLTSYLRRLTTIYGHRGRHSIWVREGDTPAVVGARA